MQGKDIELCLLVPFDTGNSLFFVVAAGQALRSAIEVRWLFLMLHLLNSYL